MAKEVNFKLMNGQSFNLSFDLADTIATVKSKIEAEKGTAEYPADRLKLIYNGKVLEDTATVEATNFEKFVVVMVSKPPASAAPAPAPAAAVVAAPAPAAAPAAAAPAAPADAPAAAPAAGLSVAPPAEQALTPEQEASVETVMGMGYPRDQVVAALRAAFFNADRAVEYLLMGIPEGGAAGAEAAAEGALDVSGDDEGEEGMGGAGAGLDFLQMLPQFAELRSMVRANPEVLPALIQQIAQTNPQLMEAISQNQEEFIRMINGEDEGDMDALGAGAGAGQGQQGVPPGARVVQVTQAESEAINRLKSMGFPEALVLEAYFACDKNEELAVNYIMERMDEAADF